MVKKSVLIVGEDPALIDFGAPDAPKNMNAAKIMTGLTDSVARLQAAGHEATYSSHGTRPARAW